MTSGRFGIVIHELRAAATACVIFGFRLNVLRNDIPIAIESANLEYLHELGDYGQNKLMKNHLLT